MRAALYLLGVRTILGISLILPAITVQSEPAPAVETGYGTSPTIFTNVAQMTRLVARDMTTSHSVRLEGAVWYVDAEAGLLVLSDSSGVSQLELDLHGQSVHPGDTVRLEGNGTVAKRGVAILIGARGPVVDNDGIHTMTRKSGTVYLSADRHPFRLCWFNGTGRFGLAVEYEGPDVPRQRVPNSVLSRIQVEGTNSNLVAGTEYRCYEGAWEKLPDFSQLTASRTGVATNFDLGARTRDTYVGLEFSGLIEIKRAGWYTFHLNSDDGSKLFIGKPVVRLSVVGHDEPRSPAKLAVGQMLPRGGACWAQVEGRVTLALKQGKGMEMELRAGAGCMRVVLATDEGLSSAPLAGARIRATGFCQSCVTTDGESVAGLLLVPSGKNIEWVAPEAENASALPSSVPAEGLRLLTRAEEVRHLSPQEAQRRYPVRIQGVVTCLQPDREVFVVQDMTTALRIDAAGDQFKLARVGEFVEVLGETAETGVVKLREVRCLGAGILPEPARPAWDQLMNGSLDSQWVEIAGLVESLTNRPNGWSRVNLRTRAGVLKVDLRKAGVRPEAVEKYENAAVRLRGCMFADWNLPSLRLKVGQIRMYDVEVIVDQPAPADPFSIPTRTAASLVQFDPTFDFSRQVKVAGQVLYARGADYFMVDGVDGLRFLAKQPLGLEPGDLVEVVGFPELSGAAPVLRGAVARKLGQAPPPKPLHLAPTDLMDMKHDSTRVQVEGVLASVGRTPAGQVLEMRSESWRFLARLKSGEAPAQPFRPGSRLELVGVYCAQGGYQALGEDVVPLDLLVNSASDIRVLAQPSWWTLERLLVVVGVLGCVLAAMALWVIQLRRKVEQRTAELETQIQSRERIERQRGMEQERARIAQDLHDELGSDITEIGMLAARAKTKSDSDEERIRYLDQVAGKAREMVAALEEIVWAMNPMRNSLESLVSYFCFYADRFLGLANIKWRLEESSGPADQVVDARLRHQLFLVFKEALTNIVRHSGATEVQLTIGAEQGELRFLVADNGRGLPGSAPSGSNNGIANMKARVEKLGGRFEVSSAPGQGTTLQFSVPSN